MPDWIVAHKALSPEKDKWEKFVIDSQKMWSERVVISDSEMQKIESRTLIVLGDQDAITLEHGINMHRTIEGSAFCVLPDTPHEAFMANPDLINTVAIDFLTKK